jgi:signal transduction histidine kinase/PAS domain-containing protein
MQRDPSRVSSLFAQPAQAAATTPAGDAPAPQAPQAPQAPDRYSRAGLPDKTNNAPGAPHGDGPDAPRRRWRPENALSGARDVAARSVARQRDGVVRGARWIATSTLQPAWLPPRWRHPAVGYVVAGVAQIITVLFTAGLGALLPGLEFRSDLPLLVTVLIALTFGAGPSLFATLVGTALVDYFLIPPLGSFVITERHNQAGAMLFLAVGVAISILASQVARSQRTAEEAGAEAQAARAEAAGRAEQLQTSFDAMGDAVLLYDARGRLVRRNTALDRMLRLDLAPDAATLPDDQRYIPLAVLDTEGQVVAHDQMPQARALRGESFTGERAVDLRMSAFDGRLLEVSVSAAPVRDARGRVVGSVAIYRDVTDRRRLERSTREALEALLEMAQALVEAPLAPALASTTQPVTGAGTGARATASSQPIPPARQAARRLAELTQNVLGCRRVAITAVSPEDERMQPLAVIGLTREQEEQVFASWPASIRVSDSVSAPDVARLRAGKVLTHDLGEEGMNAPRNPYHARSILLAPGLLRGKLVCLLSMDYASDPHDYSPQEQALASAVTQLVALVIERERLVIERAEGQARELALRSSQEQMDRFLSLASHELRTPLTTMKASIQMTSRRVTKLAGQHETPLAAVKESLSHTIWRLGHRASDPPEAEPEPWVKVALTEIRGLERLLGRAEEAVERQARLVSDLLDVSRIRSGKLDRLVARLDLVALAQDAIEEQRLAYPERAIALEQAPGPIYVLADGDRIRQALANYLINALRYSPVTAPVTVSVSQSLATGYARVSVRDSGPGIARGELERIWERFHRAPGVSHTSRSGIGLGLGLFICREIIERHGGRVGVRSEEGQGAEFWFTLPLAAESGDTRT